MPSCIVIGAGISGLTTAQHLQSNGWSVILLDKGRGVGGRMATRRLAQARADHGAQYFSARTPEFQRFLLPLIEAGMIREWKLPFKGEHPRYIASEGMSSIAKFLAKNLNVKTQTRAIQIQNTSQGYVVLTDTAEVFSADKIVITAPVPQVLDLFKESQISLTPTDQSTLENITYAPCIAVLVALKAPQPLPSPGFLKFEEGPVSWVADNLQKGISTAQPSVTIHASPEYSRQYLENIEEAAQNMLSYLKEWISPDMIDTYQVHRWRYSLAEKRHHAPFLKCNLPFDVLIGGDGFGMGNVEGAFISGHAMAEYLLS
ncbi:MAG: NAD(P)/FAD-dependent oxidoreductase [Runella sp.]